MILVTGVTGTTGGATLRALHGTGARVRVLVRDPARFTAPADVEVAVGSFDDAASLAAALQGVESAFLVHPGSETQVAAESAFIAAAREAGLPHLVRLSVVGADQPGIDALRFGASHRDLEAVATGSGIPTTFLRPNGFMQNYLGQAATIREPGVFYSSLSPAAVVSHVDAEDIGAVAAKVLTEPGHAGAAYTLTGPEPLSDDEIASRFSRVLGREVTHVQVTPADARASMVSMGYPEWVADGITELAGFYETGHAGGVAPDIEQLLGRPARSFDDFVADHRDAFGAAGA
jgi:uncharacterized protein YbjT (DUF2867 family)